MHTAAAKKNNETSPVRNNDETAHLLQTPANAEHLRKSIDSFRRGNMKSVSLDELEKPPRSRTPEN